MNDSTLQLNVSFHFKDNQGSTALIAAILGDNPEIVNILVKAGADVDKQDFFGYTALILAVLKGNLEMVKALVVADADLDIRVSHFIIFHSISIFVWYFSDFKSSH